jgi:predicted nuclease of predicted toxin-antitoxin system
LSIAFREQHILLTSDKDFGDLVFRHRLPHAGVILFRLGYVPIEARIASPQRVFDDHAGRLDQFIVVSHRGSRAGSPSEP